MAARVTSERGWELSRWLLAVLAAAGCVFAGGVEQARAAAGAGSAQASAAEAGAAGVAAGSGRFLSANAVSWEDPVGDEDSGLAPDITAVSVFNTDGGVLVIRVDVPGSELLIGGELLAVFFDVDQNTMTGNTDALGAEYSVTLSGRTGTARLRAWEGGAWRDVVSAVSASWRFGATVTVDLRELGSPAGFNFWVAAVWQGASRDYYDLAPGGDGWWSYQVMPPVPAPEAPPDPDSSEPEELLARPPSGGDYGYEESEATLDGEHVVVHYVTEGLDAPPLNDDDGNGLPDYVEEIAASADRALEEFERLGFESPLPDTGGPDERPDLYVKRLAARVLGLAVSPGYGEGGSFVLVDTRLDRSIDQPRFNLQTTVAHELFHLIQYAYLPDGDIPRWVAEGTASAIEFIAFPEVSDIGRLSSIDSWLEEPWRELHDESNSCERCYGGAIWWYNLHRRDPGLLPAYFDQLSRLSRHGRDFGIGAAALSALIGQRAAFGRGFGSLYEAFVEFSEQVYRAGLGPGTFRTLTPKRTPRTTRVFRVKGLSTHYIPVTIRQKARRLQLGIEVAGGPVPDVRLLIGGPNGRAAKPRLRRNGRTVVFAPRLRNNRERGSVMLIITSGHKNPATYQITHQTR